MLQVKRLSLFCSNAVIRKKCSNSLIRREFSSKNPKNRNKIHPKIEITAKNDFVTHQLNSSIAVHLRRQQKLWNNVVKEQKQLQKNRKTDYYFDKYSGKIEQTDHHGQNKMRRNQLQDNWKRCSNDGNNARANQKAAYNAQKFDDDEDGCSENDSDDFSLEQLDTPNWESMNLTPMTMNFYEASTTTEERCIDEVREFRTKNHVTLNSAGPKPIFKFNELNDLSQFMIDEIERRNFLDCTPVQSQAVPIALSGANMIAVSPKR